MQRQKSERVKDMKQTIIFGEQEQDSLKLIPCLLTLLFIFSLPCLVFAEDHGHKHSYAVAEHENKKAENEQHEEDENHHENHEVHEVHEGHEEPELKFSDNELKEFSIELSQAGPGVINKTLDLTGEVIVEPERLYHVVPRVSGVVLQVYKHLGDAVKAGDLLATLSSRNLADAKAQFVAADSLLQLANANLQRERKLYKGKVTAKREFLAAKQVQTEMSIKRKAAKQRLLALGLTEQSIRSLLQNSDTDLTLYELRAPADGAIINKHAAIGEVLETNTRSFTVADLSQVWVNLTVYQKDLPLIQLGQQVLIFSRFGLADQEVSAHSAISWLSPTLDEKTRSATARVVIDNHGGYWRPGLFVSGKIAFAETKADVVVPLTALQTVEGQTVVFVQHAEDDFEPQAVKVGRKDRQQVEILQGLKAGQTYVSQNAFTLKAQLQKGEFGEGHSH